MITYLKCPNCSGIISARDNEKIVQCATCGKKYVNPNFRDTSVSQPAEKVEKKVNCKNCGKAVSESFEFCPYCGAQLKTRCRKCGNVLREEDLFCSRCGAPTKEVEPQNEAVLDEQNENVDTTEETTVANIDVAQSERVFEYADKIDPSKKAKRPKYSKKAVLSVVKNAICLTLCILLFAFAFCPIMKIDTNRNVGFSGVDYIEIMGAASKKYDTTTDADKLDEWQKQIFELYEELNELDQSYTYDEQNRIITFGIKYRALEHRISLEQNKLAVSITSGGNQRIYIIGIVSLLYILFATAMLVLSAFGFVYSVIELRSNGKKQFKIWYGYHNLLPFFLFLSLAFLIACSNIGTFISLTMIFRLLFECIAIVFVMADKLSEKGARRQAIFKAVSIALCIIAVGVCFAPCFATTKTFTKTRTVDGEEVTEKYDAHTRDSAKVFLGADISQYRYDKERETMYGDSFLSSVKSAVDSHCNSSYDRYYFSRVDDVVYYVYLDEFAENGKQIEGGGYYLMIVAILLVGVYACLAQFDSKNCVTARRVILIIALVSFAVALILGGVMCGKVNKYMDDNDIEGFKMSLDAGLICATLFAIGTVVCDFLSNTIEKKRGKKEQLVQVQE